MARRYVTPTTIILFSVGLTRITDVQWTLMFYETKFCACLAVHLESFTPYLCCAALRTNIPLCVQIYRIVMVESICD